MVVLRVLQDPRRKYISDVKPDAIGQLAHTLFRRSQSEYRTIARSFPPSREKKTHWGRSVFRLHRSLMTQPLFINLDMHLTVHMVCVWGGGGAHTRVRVYRNQQCFINNCQEIKKKKFSVV